MNIQSTLEKGIPTAKSTPGAYEWWYFDAISDDGETEFVIIFYEGNPFSRRYIKHQQNGLQALPEKFPAISISIYQNKQPVYYSFTEVAEEKSNFKNDKLAIKIEKHQLSGIVQDDHLIFQIELDETLPSGDSINAHLEFVSNQLTEDISTISDENESLHQWHVIQPRAKIRGKIRYGHGDDIKTIHFKGKGYHDHNIGSEPLKKQFDHWYWGRFHFNKYTLIYYLMGNDQPLNTAWLLDNKQGTVVQSFDDTAITDYSRTLYGLHTARKIGFKNDGAKVTVQQSTLLDDGPFYQRFNSDAFLTLPGQDLVESCCGITEYLNPPRIYNKLYWPLTNMRIRYKKEDPHWVQRSKMLYRWTW